MVSLQHPVATFVSKIHFFEIFAFEKCHDLEVWGYGSFEVIENDTIHYDLQLMVSVNCCSIL